MAGMVNHAVNNETAKITDTIYLARDTVMEHPSGFFDPSVHQDRMPFHHMTQ